MPSTARGCTFTPKELEVAINSGLDGDLEGAGGHGGSLHGGVSRGSGKISAYLRLRLWIFHSSNNPVNAPVWHRWKWFCSRKQNFDKLTLFTSSCYHDWDFAILHFKIKVEAMIQSSMKGGRNNNRTSFFFLLIKRPLFYHLAIGHAKRDEIVCLRFSHQSK